MLTVRPPRENDFAVRARQVLEHLSVRLGLDVWAVTRRQGEDWVVLHSHGIGASDLVGQVRAWDDTLCAQVLAGRAPTVTPDVAAEPALAELCARQGLTVGAFVSAPLTGEGDEVLGTLCGIGVERADDRLLAAQDEIELLAGVLGALMAAELELERDARRRESTGGEACLDDLTGLGNRWCWDRALVEEDLRCCRLGGTASVVTVDVDGLRSINDSWGHHAGDRVLQEVARVLRSQAGPGDVAARLDGDAFGVLLAEVGVAGAGAFAARLRAALTEAGAPASVGFASRGPDGLADAWRQAHRVLSADKGRPGPVPPVADDKVVTAPPPTPGLVEELLELARRHTGSDVAFVGRFESGTRVLRAISSGAPPAVGPGHVDDLEQTYCARIVDGRLPGLIPDTTAEPAALALPITSTMQIGAYVGVPVHLADGQLYGTLCCLSHRAQPGLDERARVFLEAIAISLQHVLSAEEGERAGRHSVLEAIDDLLARRTMRVVYQPVVDLVTGTVRGVEALARFDDLSRTTEQWFTAARHVQRGAELELHAARMALAQRPATHPELWLNLSASVLASPAAQEMLAAHDVSRLVLEVSEHEQVSDYAALRSLLTPLRARGLLLAVDDAGAGFASLRHVLELAPDVVKLDISLVCDLAEDPSRQALVVALVAFCRDAGALVVAEGVENEGQLAALRAAGVGLGQGYHLGRPVPGGRGQLTTSRSTTNTSVSFGPIAPPAPRAP